MIRRSQKGKQGDTHGSTTGKEESRTVAKPFGNAADIAAFDKIKAEDSKNISRWKSEGGKN